MDDNSSFSAKLICYLDQAIKFYQIELELEQKRYETPFLVTIDDQNTSKEITCNGCDERIKIEIPYISRRKNLLNSNFLVEFIIVIISAIIPLIFPDAIFISVGLYYSIIFIGFLYLCYHFYQIMFSSRVKPDTLMFWHDVEEDE